MPIDPAKEIWRQGYVARQSILARAQRAQEAAALQNAQKTLFAYLAHSDLDRTIRNVLIDLHQAFTTTKITKDQLPLDGEIIKDWTPLFIVDHQGLPGFKKRYEIPGLRYCFYLEHREVVITITFCKKDGDGVLPHIHLTHRNDRTHFIDWEAEISNPDSQNLNSWLIDQICGLISKRYPCSPQETKTAADIHVSRTPRIFYPDSDD